MPSTAFVLAAGEGRRLLPFTATVPKPLLPVLNVPLLTHTLAGLARAGVRQIWINAWHLAAQIEAHVDGLAFPGVLLRVVVEDELLGTGGGLANLWRASGVQEPVLALVADVVADFDYRALAAAHERALQEADAVATMALTRRADPAQFGAVEVDDQGRLTDIVGLLGRPGVEAAVNASAHVLSPRFLERLPREPSCFVRQGYVPALAAGLTCAGWFHDGPWHETGSPAALLAAQGAALDGSLPVARQLAREGGTSRPAGGFVHPTARIAADARLDATTVVGAGARIGPGACLEGCLVLPCARVPGGAHLVRRIVDSALPHPPETGPGDDDA